MATPSPGAAATSPSPCMPRGPIDVRRVGQFDLTPDPAVYDLGVITLLENEVAGHRRRSLFPRSAGVSRQSAGATGRPAGSCLPLDGGRRPALRRIHHRRLPHAVRRSAAAEESRRAKSPSRFCRAARIAARKVLAGTAALSAPKTATWKWFRPSPSRTPSGCSAVSSAALTGVRSRRARCSAIWPSSRTR